VRLEEVFNRFSLSETLNDLIVFTDPAKDVGLCQLTFHLLEKSIRRHLGLSIGLSWTRYCPHSDDQGPKAWPIAIPRLFANELAAEFVGQSFEESRLP
jgi:hypothetical protein